MPRILFLSIFLVLGFAHQAFAQSPAVLAADAGPEKKVGAISIKFNGVSSVSEQLVRANMSLREGTSLDDALIDRDIRTLYRSGLFEFIEVKRTAHADGTVDLLFDVTARYRVLSIHFEGNKAYKEGRLLKEIKTVRNGGLDERQIKEDTQKLYEFYQKSGYNRVRVTYSIERNSVTGFSNVTYKVVEGARVHISSIIFQGNKHVSARKLRKTMETKKWHIFSWLTGSGRFKDTEFDDDLEKLRDYYREEGYLDVEIPADRVAFKYPSESRLALTIVINEGRQYRVGDIAFSGNKLFKPWLLSRIVRQRTGKIFVPSKLDKDTESIEDLYGRSGYLDTRVRLVRKPNLATGAIDVEYVITESEKFQVESVIIDGNTKTKNIVILRELLLGPGDVFDSVRMKISKARLENTRFFEEQSVNVTPETTNIPGRRNLRISVKEGRTGNLTFGAGFSSLEKAVVFAELSQSNFDLTNRKSFFQGDGQKFRLRLQLGSRSSEALLAFEEPWLFERELALGFQLGRTTSDYDSSYYTEVRTFIQVYLRKRLFRLLEGTLTYSIENSQIKDVDPNAPLIYQLSAGKATISKLGFSLLRDTRDKIINTTSGNRVELEFNVAGGPLGGNENYYKVEFRGSQFYPIFEFHDQVMAFILRTGTAQEFGDSADVYPFDKFYLGGPDNLRGFQYREVGPKDTFGRVLYGKSYGFFSAEYSIDIVKPIRFALFYDAGFVNADSYDFNPADFNDNFGFGLRLFVAGAPLSLDFGIPLTTDKFNNAGNQFNFSFGTRF